VTCTASLDVGDWGLNNFFLAGVEKDNDETQCKSFVNVGVHGQGLDYLEVWQDEAANSNNCCGDDLPDYRDLDELGVSYRDDPGLDGGQLTVGARKGLMVCVMDVAEQWQWQHVASPPLIAGDVYFIEASGSDIVSAADNGEAKWHICDAKNDGTGNFNEGDGGIVLSEGNCALLSPAWARTYSCS